MRRAKSTKGDVPDPFSERGPRAPAPLVQGFFTFLLWAFFSVLCVCVFVCVSQCVCVSSISC